jgi:hypothetical protein
MATTPDYAILAAPRISREGFRRILADAGSPAAPVADAAYDAAVGYGVDPAVLLGVFRKESSYGRAGRAARNKSWGNIKGMPADGAGFRIYPDWATGARDAARLLAVYGRNEIRPGTRTDTVQTMPYVWAPGPGADLYGDQLARWIGDWATRYPTSAGAQPATAVPAQAVEVTASGFARWLGKTNEDVFTQDDYDRLRRQFCARPPWEGILVPTIDLCGLFERELAPRLRPYIGRPIGEIPFDEQLGAALRLGIPEDVLRGAADTRRVLSEADLSGLYGVLVGVAGFVAVLALILVGLYLVARS